MNGPLDRVDRAIATFQRAFGRRASWVARAPGRVNLIGEHTDYNEGFVLPMAIDRSIVIAGDRSTGATRRIHSDDFGETRIVDVDRTSPDPEPSFSDYAVGVHRELRERGIEAPPFDAVIASDLPSGSGLSSSAALDVALALLLAKLADRALSPTDVALVAMAAENRFVGVHCGIMDPLVIVHGREGHALRIDCRSLEVEPVRAIIPSHAWLVIHSGVPRALAQSAYNQRRAECERAVQAIRVQHPEVRALRDVRLEWLESTTLDSMARKRARHVIEESARTIEAAQVLRDGDVNALGRLFAASHESLRDLYEVTGPELDRLVELCREEGAAAARMTGAGFGGCVVALAEEARADAIAEVVVRRYRAETTLEPRAFRVRAVDGASVSPLS